MEDKILDVYSNSVKVTMSLYDFTLEFGLNSGLDEAEPVARVRMSPQHAKSLLLLLQRFLGQYGESFQEINLPEELENQLTGKAVAVEDNVLPTDREDGEP
jgi:hypothetical protein